MKKNYFLLALSLLTLSLFPQNAYGDEMWSTEEYNVIYEEDRNNTAIWSYNNRAGYLFIHGLAGEYYNRESYNGYWTQESSSLRCDTYREGINGERSYHWGRFEITFIDPDFPSRWQGKFGLCDGETTITINGIPFFGDNINY